MVESGQQETNFEQCKKLMRNYSPSKLQGSESLGTQTTTAQAFTQSFGFARDSVLALFQVDKTRC
jgi:hypothetical protein